MQIVIDIPDKYISIYTSVKEWIDKAGNDCKVRPLPEGHGDLIDKGDVLHDIDCDEEMRLGKNAEWVREVIRNTPTIIEASENTNKEESK